MTPVTTRAAGFRTRTVSLRGISGAGSMSAGTSVTGWTGSPSAGLAVLAR